eukprot:11123958-Alexandrium_andersonii.AAC.1
MHGAEQVAEADLHGLAVALNVVGLEAPRRVRAELFVELEHHGLERCACEGQVVLEAVCSCEDVVGFADGLNVHACSLGQLCFVVGDPRSALATHDGAQCVYQQGRAPLEALPRT